MTIFPGCAGVAVTALAPAYTPHPTRPCPSAYQAPRPPIPGQTNDTRNMRVPGRAAWTNGLPQHRCLNPNRKRGIRT